MKTLAVVPARAGSKGVVGKNTRDFCGKPLMAWSIEVGKETCDRVVVSSDNPEALRIAEAYGVEALARPPELAEDETPMLDVLKHVLACETKASDCVVLLQPTQPLRKPAHVRQAFWVLTLNPRVDSVVSVCEIPAHMSPDFAYTLEDYVLSRMLPSKATRRQDCRQAYYRDGTVYAMRTRLLRSGEMYGKARALLIPENESCSIDTEADWTRAEEMWRRQHGNV